MQVIFDEDTPEKVFISEIIKNRGCPQGSGGHCKCCPLHLVEKTEGFDFTCIPKKIRNKHDVKYLDKYTHMRYMKMRCTLTYTQI
jgi:hypothetical protein